MIDNLERTAGGGRDLGFTSSTAALPPALYLSSARRLQDCIKLSRMQGFRRGLGRMLRNLAAGDKYRTLKSARRRRETPEAPASICARCTQGRGARLERRPTRSLPRRRLAPST